MDVKQIFLVLAAIISCFSCKVKKDTMAANDENLVEVINMRKTACFGTCPVYTLSVFSDHSIVFNGKKYTSKLGLHEKELSNEDFKQLISIFNSSDFMSLEEDYPTNVSDVPSTIIIYNNGSEVKTVRARSNGPNSFNQLADQLDEIANSENWKDLTGSANDGNDNIENQIILQLNSDIDVAQWSNQFEEYDFKIIKRISPKLNYWLAEYDTKKIDRNLMLRELLNHEGVKNAEFNKKVYIR